MNKTNTNYPLVETYTEEMQLLLLRAQQGDLTVLPELRSLLESKPELWKEVGDLAEHAELSMLALIGGKDHFIREAVRKKLAELKAEWAGSSPSPLERLLVDRIGVCWLQVHHADQDAITALARDRGATSLSLYAQRRLDSAHRRYLQAIKQLATVRKLLQPRVPPIEAAARLSGRKSAKRNGRVTIDRIAG